MRSSLNLMSLATRRQECLRARLRQWLAILGVTAAGLCLFGAERYWAYQHAAHKQLRMEAKYEPIADLQKSNKSLTRQIDAIRKEEQFVLALSNREPVVTLLGVLGESIADSDNHVFLQKIELNNAIESNSAATQQSTLELAGIANSGSAVKDFTDTLQSSIPFGKVGVTSTKEQRLKQQTVQDFSLQCTF